MSCNNIDIRSFRLILKPFTSLDANEVFKYITPTLTKYMAWDPPKNRQEFDEIWHKWLDDIKNGRELICVVRNNTNHEFLGLAGLHQIQSESPELGIWIREDRHRSGFGREAVKSIAYWASKNLKIKSFIYPVAIENFASRQIAESLGGTPLSYKKERKYDSVTYSIPISNLRKIRKMD